MQYVKVEFIPYPALFFFYCIVLFIRSNVKKLFKLICAIWFSVSLARIYFFNRTCMCAYYNMIWHGKGLFYKVYCRGTYCGSGRMNSISVKFSAPPWYTTFCRETCSMLMNMLVNRLVLKMTFHILL